MATELISGEAVNNLAEIIVGYPSALVVFIISVLVCMKVLNLGTWASLAVSLALAILTKIYLPTLI